MKKLLMVAIVSVWAAGLFDPAPTRAESQQVLPVRAFAAAARGARAERTYFTAVTATEEELLAFRRELIANGARHVNLFVPDVIVCELPADLDVRSLQSYPDVVRSEEGDMEPSRASAASPTESLARLCYERAETQERFFSSAPPLVPGDDFTDVVRVITPDEARSIQRALRSAGAALAEARLVGQTSEFFGGDILVQLVLPESNGQYETQTENWSEAEVAEVISGVASGMLDVQGKFPTMPMNFVFQNYPRAVTGYEPIQHNMGSDYLWVRDTISRLAPEIPDDNVIAQVHAFNEKGRAAKGTDFVFTGFVANSENADRHIFNGADYTAYAYLGGPYNIVPYPAGLDPNGIGFWLVFSQIFQHETGHTFYTLDEYQSYSGPCTERSGYLNYPNTNKDGQFDPAEDSCDPDGPIECLMRYAPRKNVGRPWCKYTQGQMGVVDADESSIPDLFESKPVIQFETAAVETVEVSSVTVRVKAISTAVPNANPFQAPENRIDYAAPLRKGEFSIAGLVDDTMSPADGRWDEIEEDMETSISSLAPGLTTVGVRVQNSLSLWSDRYTKRIYFIGVNYATFNASVKQDRIRVYWEVVSEVYGALFDVYRLEPGDELPGQLIATDVPPSGPEVSGYRPYAFEDHNIVPGRTYEYYVMGDFTLQIGGSPREFHSASRTIAKTAMYPVAAGSILSAPAPNPSNGGTKFSVVIPRTYAELEGSTAGSTAAAGQRVATDVVVDVFDVTGRRVKNIHNGLDFEDVLTLEWDGTSANNTPVPSGVYFIRAKAGDITESRKVLLVR